MSFTASTSWAKPGKISCTGPSTQPGRNCGQSVSPKAHSEGPNAQIVGDIVLMRRNKGQDLDGADTEEHS